MRKLLPIYMELHKRDWTQRRLAEICGINEATISRILRGRYVPNNTEKELISNALGRESAELFRS
jgi:transcriptional regulator with XRE-family HTH domain